MSKKVTLRHQLPDGDVFTRTTAKAYTHVLVARENFEAGRQRIQNPRPEYVKQLRRNYEYHRAVIRAGFGNLYTLGGLTCTHPVDQGQYDKAFEHLKGVNNPDTYVQREVAGQLYQFERRAQNRKYGDLVVISWHTREDLARKAADRLHSDWVSRQVEAINNGEREVAHG